MNAKQTKLLLLSVLTLPMLGSCSLLDSLNFLKDGKTTAATPVEVLTDRETVRTEAPTKAYTPEELGRGIVKGDWAIDSVMGKRATGETAPYLKFDPTQKRVYGNDGCNTINATYAYNPTDSTFRFANVLSTMRLCSVEGLTDVEFSQALGRTRFYSWEIKDNDYLLTLLDAQRKPVMILYHQNFDFLNGAWKVTGINRETVNIADMKLVIDIDEGKVHGNTGCNLLNGNIEIEMDAPNSISFANLLTTRMACSHQEMETDLLVALEETVTAKALSKDIVVFLNARGQSVLQLKRDRSI